MSEGMNTNHKGDTLGKESENFNPFPDTLFEDIALAFSGGGFRASSFALGTLSLFDEIKIAEETEPLVEDTLLKKVRYLASASGGTIATALYALYNTNNQTFGAFYKKLFNATEGDKLLKRALEILTTKSCWSQSTKNRNLINAFALAYDELLFSSKTLNITSATIGDLKRASTTHLHEVCCNATEFYHGLLFRQTVNLKPTPGAGGHEMLYGNYAMSLSHKAAEGIRLADALAASSCFPGGFEPILFPDDFVHDGYSKDTFLQGLNISLENGEMEKPSVGLMDGGITDNLGVESMMQADMRKAHPHRFDLMITNDVGSHYMPPFKVSTPATLWLGELNILFWIVLAAAVICAGAYLLWIAFHICNSTHSALYALVGALCVLTSGAFLFAIGYLYLRIQGVLQKASALDLRHKFGSRITYHFFKELLYTPINTLVWMIEARVSSASTLVSDLFLKRVRQLLDNKFYESPEWAGRAKGNRIYDLSFKNDLCRKGDGCNIKGHGFDELEPSLDMQKIAEIAYRMTTTLWFDRQRNAELHAQACLIACGQFTACYNILDYIARTKVCAGYEKLPEKYRARTISIEEQLRSLYTNLKNDPFFLYNRLGKEYLGLDFSEVSIGHIPPLDDFLIRKIGSPPLASK